MSFVEKIGQLNEQIDATFDQAFAALRREVQDRLREGHEDLQRRLEGFTPPHREPFVAAEDLAPGEAVLQGAHAEARGAAAGELRDALAALDRARSQAEVLRALIGAASGFCSRSALLLVRAGELSGWGGHGFDAGGTDAVQGVALDPGAGSAWERAAGIEGEAAATRLSAAECATLCGRLESPLPAFGVLVPLVLRDRVVAVLYGDELAAAGRERPDGVVLANLQSLVYVAALAIETLPFRQREATASLISAPGAAASATSAPAAAAPTSAASTSAPAAAAPTSAASTSAPAAAAPTSAASAGSTSAPAASAPTSAASTSASAAATAAASTSPPAPAASGTGAHEAHAAAVAGEHEAHAAADAGPDPEATEQGFIGHTAPPEPAAGDGAGATGGADGDEAAHGAAAFRAAAPYAVSPTALYDSPAVPLVQRTAEMPRPVWPPVHTPPEPPEPAERQAAAFHPGEVPSLHAPEAAAESSSYTPYAAPEAAAEPPAPVRYPAAVEDLPRAPQGAADNETVLLPPVALRDVAAPSPAAPSPSTSGYHDTVAPVLAGPGALRAVPGLDADERFAAPAAPAPAAPTVPLGPLPHPAAEAQDHGAPETAEPPLAPVTPLIPPGQTGSMPFEPLRGAPLGGTTPEVRPPSGLQGPGWAFATTRVPAANAGEEALHDEARRLARLLVSEIKLYNEEQVEAGRRNRDIYERLREDIDRSRQMYEERVEPRVVRSTDYFYQELVRILAAGDPKALGI
jgi:hypothetical protein